MSAKTAKLYRMDTPDHHCPFGQKSRHLLRSHGFEVEDHPLRTRAETDAFMEAEGVETTPQTYIDGERIGGYEDLRKHLGLSVPDPDAPTYRPIVAIFAIAFALALVVVWLRGAPILSLALVESFVALGMTLLGLQKLKDVEGFSTMFLNYDLLARRWVPYSYVYPYAETLAGVLMLAGVLIWLAAPLALFIGAIGAASVIQAVWIEKRELRCACAGSGTNVPLGPVSLTENLAMVAMGLWMFARAYLL
ncbi:MauE/DoxX family redox-associated membrane protein [Pararhodobacter sp. SW119]|uniref:MauE/DoxX family redox-associated membrane protein n=1 Tax=Pararhodobacter sp. SW119 TaxID=2780075 RepID=UPI001AE0BAFE|nr:MauE/DoxX family redox-associated membrane protein [Pararhodobacter sp. SW119]